MIHNLVEEFISFCHFEGWGRNHFKITVEGKGMYWNIDFRNTGTVFFQNNCKKHQLKLEFWCLIKKPHALMSVICRMPRDCVWSLINKNVFLYFTGEKA